MERARAAGLLVPPTNVVEDLTTAMPDEWPLIIKPALALSEVHGVLKRPTGVVCADRQEFESARVKAWPSPTLIQPFLRGVGEGLFGHVSADGVVAWSAHRRIRMVNPQGSASSACDSTSVDESLCEPAERFLQSIGWRGMFMLEFLRDEQGRAWFMELNGRAWGSMALARRRGFEYPAWTVQAALDADFRPSVPASPPDVRCRHIGMEVAHAAFVLRGPRSSALVEWPKRLQTMLALAKIGPTDRVYNWNRSEPGVLVADTWQTLAYYLRRTLRARS
jgi:predicted ATP-grasp superfamily ATP-dependent carboligase